MSYHFGTEIAQFTLKVYQPGDEIDQFDDPVGYAVDPDTLEILDDNGNTDDWTEQLPRERIDHIAFGCDRFKALKPMWVIELDHFPQGGLAYERSEGDIRSFMEEWIPDVAAMFKARRKPTLPKPTEPATPLLDALDCFAAGDTERTRHPGEIDCSFYAVFHSSWSGGGCDSYVGDYDYEMELEFVGELAKIEVK